MLRPFARFSTTALLALGASSHQVAGQSAGSGTSARDTVGTMTLSQALARAHRLRPQAQLAAAVVSRARGSAQLTALVPNPFAIGQVDERTPTHQSTLTQPLAWLVRRSADVGTGRATVSRATADSVQIIADMGRDVQRAFFGALAAAERLRLAQEQSHLADSLVLFADRRVSAGEIAVFDRDQIAQEASRMRLTAALSREQSRVAQVDFARAVAWDGGPLPHPVGALTDALDTVVPSAPEFAFAKDTTLTALPGLQAVLADSAAAAARWRAARRAQIPVPAIVIGLEWGANGVASTTTTRDARATSLVGLSMPLPIWNQGREATAEARGAAQEASARAAEARLTFAAQLSAAQIRASETAERARFARDTLYPDATRLRAGAVRLYEAGRTGLLPVLDAIRVERDVAQILVQELLAFQQARADLNAILGRWP